MTATLRRFALALLASLAPCLPAHATSYSIDYSDLWWNSPPESESGWGMNVIQQNEILFLTFFVYGPDNTPRWYVASSVTPTSPQPADAVRFSGKLYRTAGPWFGAANFNPAAVTVTEVGSVTVTFDSPNTATLSYTIDGTSVVKAITRQTYRVNAVGGAYVGGMIATASQCSNSAYNGLTDILGAMTVTQTSSQANFRVSFTGSSGAAVICTYVGNYEQQGRMATVSGGTFACVTNGVTAESGTFTMTALDSQLNGFHSTFTGKDQFCTYNGRFSGIRDMGG